MTMTTTTPKQNGNLAKSGGGSKDLRAFLESPAVQAKLKEVATAHMKPEDLTRLTLLALSRQPDLVKCSQHSILRSLMDAAALGIKPGGLMGRGYLVPRFNNKTGQLECQFDPGWRGLADVAKRSGAVKKIAAHAVYENDFFEVEFGTEEKLTHRPAIENRGKVVGAYAVAFFDDGTTQFESLDATDLAKIRAVSRAKSGPWKDWEEEMARKSAVRRLCKYLPYSDVLERALEAATDAEAEQPIGRTEVEVLPGESRGKSLANRIKANAAENAAVDLDLPPEGEHAPEHDADGVLVEESSEGSDNPDDKSNP